MTPFYLFTFAALCAAVVKVCQLVARRTTYKHEMAEIALCFVVMGCLAFIGALAVCIFGALPR